jgi:hypothetical protein
MSANVLTASASGIEHHLAYVDILRGYEDELAKNGVEYEEHDRKADPLSMTLIISLAVTTVLTTSLAEVVKKIINCLCDKKGSEKPKMPGQTTIVIFRIGSDEYDLQRDRVAALAKVDTLTIADVK